MNDLISRQAAIDALSKAMPSLTTPDGCGQFDREIYVAQETFVDAMQIIHDMPSAEPKAVPGIRCKYCVHFDGYYCHNKHWGDGYGNYTPPIKKEDGFCDWAERKENE